MLQLVAHQRDRVAIVTVVVVSLLLFQVVTGQQLDKQLMPLMTSNEVYTNILNYLKIKLN